MIYCSHCGKKLNPNARFCTACGTPVGDSVNQPAEPVTTRAAVPADDSIPTFAPPADDIPVFTAPEDDIPTFAPPEDDIPTFAPPENTNITHFAPPEFSGPACHHHRDEPAVTKCARCGHYICQDCAEAYGVTIGEYAGQSLCYDCCQALVQENIDNLQANKRSIMFTFITTLIGMALGFFFALSEGGDIGAALLFMVIGGCFWTFLKGWFSRIVGAIQGGGFNMTSFLIGLILGFVIEAILSIYRTIRKVVECLIYLKRTSNFIEEDSNALAQMRDYMEYTQLVSRNRGVDLDTLMNQSSELFNNSYAQAVRNNGEAAADEMLRRCTTRIAENGEIIRSFAA